MAWPQSQGYFKELKTIWKPEGIHREDCPRESQLYTNITMLQ